jgi:hypothetical protein
MSHETGTDRAGETVAGAAGAGFRSRWRGAVGAMLAHRGPAWLVLRDFSIYAWSDP